MDKPRDHFNLQLFEENNDYKFQSIKGKASMCTRCTRCIAKNGNIFGFGNTTDPKIIIISDYPLNQEQDESLSYSSIGRTWLIQQLEEMGLYEHMYFTYAVLCSSVQDVAPDEETIQRCLSHLTAQITLLQPKAIVTLGEIATKEFFGGHFKGTKLIEEHLGKFLYVDPVMIGRCSYDPFWALCQEDDAYAQTIINDIVDVFNKITEDSNVD